MSNDHEKNLPDWWVVRGGIALISFIIGGMATAMGVLIYDGFIATNDTARIYDLGEYLSKNAVPLLLGLVLTLILWAYIDINYKDNIRRNL